MATDAVLAQYRKLTAARSRAAAAMMDGTAAEQARFDKAQAAVEKFEQAHPELAD